MIRILLTLILLAGCAQTPRPAGSVVAASPVTILISIDGFRADYLARGITPRLSALAANGATGVMRPSFPSVTFPNHYTIVTGKRPDNHGIVSNRFEDPAQPGMTFTMASSEPFWWTQAEPIWITAEKAGKRTATMFWPGSNIDHGGVRPTDWHLYAENNNHRQRIDSVIDWLRRPLATRPQFLTLYFDSVDTAGHRFGPDDPRTNTAVADVDSAIGRLLDELRGLGQPANIVITSDHGMAATSPDRIIRLYEIADPAHYRLIYGGAYGAIEPVAGHEAALKAKLLAKHANMQCYLKGDLPTNLAYGKNSRVPAYVCVVDSGWILIGAPPTPERPLVAGGAHGYDPATADMASLFIANGPSIKAGVKVSPFDNVDIYPLLAKLTGVPALPRDARDATLGSLVK